MGRLYRKCSVLGCEDKISSRHRFPDPKINFELFQKWIVSTGNPELLKSDVEHIYRTKKICHRHFSQKHILSNNLLLKSAFPTIFLGKDVFKTSHNKKELLELVTMVLSTMAENVEKILPTMFCCLC
ncbi:hypothetical protein ABEB36_013539 [Hypothenemus hampei]|uniref:THAP-type domain-containing protein n=1 Tax=Hypothenemus hampei TaxID=57062 RepID=A0ABD1E4W5_HYPHA